MKLVSDPGDDGGLGTDRELVVVGHRAELGGCLDQHLAKVSRLARRQPLRVGPSEQQQVSDQPPHPPRRAQCRLGGLGLFAAQLLVQQLEVGEHACQRRSQLVRGVGDELPLAVEHRLRVAARRVKRAEHPFERLRQLGDLVIGLGPRHLPARVTGALDLARGVGQLDDRAHRAGRDEQAGDQRRDRAAEDSQIRKIWTSAVVCSTSDSGSA